MQPPPPPEIQRDGGETPEEEWAWEAATRAPGWGSPWVAVSGPAPSAAHVWLPCRSSSGLAVERLTRQASLAGRPQECGTLSGRNVSLWEELQAHG